MGVGGVGAREEGGGLWLDCPQRRRPGSGQQRPIILGRGAPVGRPGQAVWLLSSAVPIECLGLTFRARRAHSGVAAAAESRFLWRASSRLHMDTVFVYFVSAVAIKRQRLCEQSEHEAFSDRPRNNSPQIYRNPVHYANSSSVFYCSVTIPIQCSARRSSS